MPGLLPEGHGCGPAAWQHARMASPSHDHRLPLLDLARGAAVLAMFGYHFAWDLTLFGFTDWPVQAHPWWLAYRTTVLSSFLAIAGIAAVQAPPLTGRKARFARRLGRLCAAGGAVSLLTYLAFPSSYVFFGVLHCLAALSLLGVAARGLPAALLLAAAGLALALPEFARHPALGQDWLAWLGLAPTPPASVDYVPLLPWAAAYLAGLALGRRLAGVAWRPGGPLAAGLGWAGRHSLLLYLVHQPVFLAMLAGLAAM